MAPQPTAGSRTLFPFQEAGVAALLGSEALLLADDMGLGKTVQTVAALRGLRTENASLQALIVAPTGLLTQWRRALDEWAPELTVMRVAGPFRDRAWMWAAGRDVVIVSYETVRNDIGAATRTCWDVVVLDEAQRIKNRATETSRALKRIPRHRSWVLTGTPLENREDDLASILEFCRPNPRGERLPFMSPGLALHARQLEVQLRRRKQDVLTELPPKTVVTLPLEMGREQRASYEEVREAGRSRIRGLGERATTMNVLEVITRLKQVCNVCPRTQRSAKLDDLSPRLEEIVASGHRALVFSQWTNERFGVGRIAEGIRHLHPLVYSGAMSGPARDACVDRFRDDPQHGALLLSLRAGGQGLNLQEASYVVHFDRWWNPAVENQATDRAHRAGQLNPVTVYCYSVVDSIEERIEQILEEKRALFAALVDGVSLDPRRFLTRDEVFGLLDLSAPPASAAARRFARDGIVAGVEGALRSAGWRVTRTRASGQAILLSVRRREGGADRRGWVACAGADAAADGLVLLTDAEVSDPAVVRMLVTDGPVDQDVTRAAADQGIPVLEAGDRVSV